MLGFLENAALLVASDPLLSTLAVVVLVVWPLDSLLYASALRKTGPKPFWTTFAVGCGFYYRWKYRHFWRQLKG